MWRDHRRQVSLAGTFEASDLLWGEAPASQAQWIAVGVSLGLLHIQANLRASCHCTPCTPVLT